MNSSASPNRCAGSLATARSTIASRSAVTAGLSRLGGSGGSETCLSAIVTAESPSNGTDPVSIS